MDADACRRDRLVEGRVVTVQCLVEAVHVHRVRQVPLVELQNEGRVRGVHAVAAQVLLEVTE